MKVEIEIEDGVIPEGYELLRLATPKMGDEISAGSGRRITVMSDIEFLSPKIILKKKRWRAEAGEGYWYVDLYFNARRGTEGLMDVDDHFYAAGNYFKTEEEAEEYAAKVRAVFEGRGR